MPQMQTEKQVQKSVDQVTFKEFQDNLLDVFTKVALEGKSLFANIVGFPSVYFYPKPQPSFPEPISVNSLWQQPELPKPKEDGKKPKLIKALKLSKGAWANVDGFEEEQKEMRKMELRETGRAQKWLF